MGLMVLTTGAAALLMGFRAPTVVTALGADTLGSGSGATDVSSALASASPAPMASAAPSAATCVVPDPAASLVPGASPAASAAPCASPTSSALPSPSAAAVTQQVLTGQGVETGFGVVQVSVTVEGTTIVDVQAVALPYDRPRSREISTAVEPMLRQEALQAQSAQIDLISGATYTSEGYSMSLQSALDQVAK
jgi:uncharacterized protein with FMN-binding domain